MNLYNYHLSTYVALLCIISYFSLHFSLSHCCCEKKTLVLFDLSLQLVVDASEERDRSETVLLSEVSTLIRVGTSFSHFSSFTLLPMIILLSEDSFEYRNWKSSVSAPFFVKWQLLLTHFSFKHVF